MGLLDSVFGGGGGQAAGVQKEYAEKALKLQEEMYGDTKENVKPWYNAGESAIAKLMTMLGLEGGDGVKTREQLVKELTPQYTNTTNGAGGGTLYRGPDGRVYDTSEKGWESSFYANNPNIRPQFGTALQFLTPDRFEAMGLKPMSQSSSSVNYDALNKAVDDALAKQGKPDDFGSLMKPFEYKDDPGFRFAQEEGNKAVQRQMAKQGKTMSPAALKAMSEYNTGMAEQGYGAAFSRDQAKKGLDYNMLAGVSGMGQVATGQQAGAAQNYANQATDLYTGIGNVVAAGKQADNAARGSMFGTLAKAGLNYASGGWSSLFA